MREREGYHKCTSIISPLTQWPKTIKIEVWGIGILGHPNRIRQVHYNSFSYKVFVPS